MKACTLVLAALVISSCVEKKSGEWSEQEIIPILFDLNVAESAVEMAHMDLRDSLENQYRRQIFEMHNIDQEEFESMMEDLSEDPKTLEKVNDRLKVYADSIREMESARRADGKDSKQED